MLRCGSPCTCCKYFVHNEWNIIGNNIKTESLLCQEWNENIKNRVIKITSKGQFDEEEKKQTKGEEKQVNDYGSELDGEH
jgi:hypothetical protein